MGFASNIINVVGAVLLVHAVYSAHEHSLLQTTLPSTFAPSTSSPSSPSSLGPLSTIIPTNLDLPLDIILETLISVLLICVGIVLGSAELKPIQWRVWAGKLEREKNNAQNKDELGPRGNPYVALEERAGFLDIRRKREEFRTWVEQGAELDEKEGRVA